MRRPFTDFAASRFVNKEAVLASLKECAGRLKERMPEAEVYLFGRMRSTPTPHSDADLVVIVPDDQRPSRERIREDAVTVFLEGPVPVDVFVVTRSDFDRGWGTGRGVCGAVAEGGKRLA